MKRFQDSNHAFWILFGKVEARSFFESFMPEFVPKNGNANQFMTDNQGLQKE